MIERPRRFREYRVAKRWEHSSKLFKKQWTFPEKRYSIGAEVKEMDYAKMMDEIKTHTFGLILTPDDRGWRFEFIIDQPYVIKGETFAEMVEEAHRKIMDLALPA